VRKRDGELYLLSYIYVERKIQTHLIF